MFNNKILSTENIFYFHKELLTDYDVAPVVAVPTFLLNADALPSYSQNVYNTINATFRCLSAAEYKLSAFDFFKRYGDLSFFMVNQADYLAQQHPLRIYGYNNLTIENKRAQIFINHCYALPKLNFWQRNIFKNHYYKGTLSTTLMQACALYVGLGFDNNVAMDFPAIIANTNFKFLAKYLDLGFKLVNYKFKTESFGDFYNLQVFLTKEKALSYYHSLPLT